MASVTYDGVWKKFGDVVAVQDRILQSKIKRILSFSWFFHCGKTTALRCLAGLGRNHRR